MRRKRLVLFIVASLFSWTIIFYFLFVYCPNCQREEQIETSVNEIEVENLENKISLLNKNYKELVNNAKKKIMILQNNILIDKLRKNIWNNEISDSKQKIYSKNDLKEMNLRGSVSVKEILGQERTNIVGGSFVVNNASAGEHNMEYLAKIQQFEDPVIAVLVISCNRVTVRRCLDQLLKWRPSEQQFPIIVSQDCSHQPTTDVIRSYGDQITLIQQPDQREIQIPLKEKKFKGYFKIARHYGWALNKTFFDFNFDTAIVVEDSRRIGVDVADLVMITRVSFSRVLQQQVFSYKAQGTHDYLDNGSLHTPHTTDHGPQVAVPNQYVWLVGLDSVISVDLLVIKNDDLDIAPDFFEYFLGTYWLLKHDPTLWCVSAWNDNGKSGLVDENEPQRLYRTDFFPGLGWMLTKSLWTELSVKWPASYWDDWIRKPEQRKDRSCIRPELPRTKTFGKIGVSNGMFFEKHLKFIKLNTHFVSFTKQNLSYLLKDIYDVTFVKEVYGSPVISEQELKNGPIFSSGPVRIPYYNKDQYKKTAKYMGLMDDFRSGVPRTAYRGVVTFSYKGRKVYLAPSSDWKAYNITWS